MFIKLYLLISAFAAPQLSFATTTLSSAAKLQATGCVLTATVSGEEVQTIRFRRSNSPMQITQVYWNIGIRDKSSSDPQVCPQASSVLLRVRGATARDQDGKQVITYPVHVRRPTKDESATLRVRFISGRDTFTNIAYSEWTFVERVAE